MSEEVEAKLMRWLKEEKRSPIKHEEPGSFFNIATKVGDLVVHVIQDINHQDSFNAVVSFIYSEDQQTLLKDLMDPESRKLYYNSVHLELQRHPFIWNYEFTDEFKILRIYSKRLYYESLTKDSFMHMYYIIAKVFMLPVTLLEPYMWKFWPGYEPPTPELKEGEG